MHSVIVSLGIERKSIADSRGAPENIVFLLQVLSLRRGTCRVIKGSVESSKVFSRQACVVSASLDGPNELSRGASLFCGWARKHTMTALRWGGQLWCLPSAPVSFDAGEFAEQAVRTCSPEDLRVQALLFCPTVVEFS